MESNSQSVVKKQQNRTKNQKRKLNSSSKSTNKETILIHYLPTTPTLSQTTATPVLEPPNKPKATAASKESTMKMSTP
jgi:hypothetical protein